MRFFVRGQEVSGQEFLGQVLREPFPQGPPLPHELKLVPPVQASYDRDSNRLDVRLNLFPLADARAEPFKIEVGTQAPSRGVRQRTGY